MSVIDSAVLCSLTKNKTKLKNPKKFKKKKRCCNACPITSFKKKS